MYDILLIGFAVIVAAGAACGVVVVEAQRPGGGLAVLVRQVAIWAGIVAFLPLAVWYGGALVSPPPDWKRYTKEEAELQRRELESKDEREKSEIRAKKESLEKEKDDAERVYYHDLFWIAFPAGLAGVVKGLFVKAPPVGAGLMFRGLVSLAAGCYSYWDRMGDRLRFFSLLVALGVHVALG